MLDWLKIQTLNNNPQVRAWCDKLSNKQSDYGLSGMDGGIDTAVEGLGIDVPDEALADSTRWIIWYLRRLVQAGDIYNKELSRDYRVSQPQLSCLLALKEYGALSLGKLSKYVLVQPSTVTGIIDRLEQKGLVRRVRNSQDRRVITIELTESGQQFTDEAPSAIPPSIVRGLRRLSAEDRRKIVKGLGTLVAFLEDDAV
jgi:DNA-binding MarR family transcriptional regulator